MSALRPRLPRRRATALLAAVAATGLATRAHAAQSAPRSPAADRIAAEIARWSRFQASTAAADSLSQQVKAQGEVELPRATRALRDGHPWLALERLAQVAMNLGAAEYVAGCGAAPRNELAAFETERARVAPLLADRLGPVTPAEFAPIAPPALRALAQIARLQVRGCFEASLDYARNTEPAFGLFYVGQAQSAAAFVTLCRELAATTAAAPAAASEPPLPPLPPLADAIADLQRELLAAFRPPAALLLQESFAAANSLLNEARQLDAAGLREGALLRLLQAAQQSAPLRRRGDVPVALRTADGLARRLTEALAPAGDGSIPGLFAAAAAETLADPGADLVAVQTTVLDLLPRAAQALAPRPLAPTAAAPRAQVTLVRWPYT